MEHLSDHIFKPSDFVMCISMPASKKSFKRNMNSGHTVDFTRRNLFRMYEFEYLKPSRPIIPSIRKKGVRIITDCTIGKFEEVVKEEYKGIILFAHNINDRIEFYDGLHDMQTVSDLIPDDRKFIFDLNACRCDNLAQLVSSTKMNIIVKYGQYRKTIPLYWLFFYEFFFELLRQKDLTYFDAMHITLKSFLKK